MNILWFRGISVQSEHVQLPLVLNDVNIGWVRSNGAGRFNIMIDYYPEFDSIFAAFSEEIKNKDGVRLELFKKDSDKVCGVEKNSWDHFKHGQVDNYTMRCELTGPHDEHRDSYTGATWEDPTVSSGENDITNVSVGKDEIERRVRPHILLDDNPAKIANVRREFAHLMWEMDQLLPAGREKNLVMESLETALMWSSKAISHDLPMAEGTEIKADPPRTKEEAQYQAAQIAFHAYQNRKPDVERTACSSTRNLSDYVPNLPESQNVVVRCSVLDNHVQHRNERYGVTWRDTSPVSG